MARVKQREMDRETARFRYYVRWSGQIQTGLVIHRQTLRKVDSTTVKVAATLLIRRFDETID